MNKTLSGILAFVPLAAMSSLLVAMIYMGINFGDAAYLTSAERVLLILTFIYMLACTALSFGFVAYYIVKTIRNPQLSTGMKVLWCFMHYQFNAFVFPIYWFLYIRHEYDDYY